MCTRVVYAGKNGMVATGRSMDWKTEMHSNLWVFPKADLQNKRGLLLEIGLVVALALVIAAFAYTPTWRPLRPTA